MRGQADRRVISFRMLCVCRKSACEKNVWSKDSCKNKVVKAFLENGSLAFSVAAVYYERDVAKSWISFFLLKVVTFGL